MKPGSSAPEWRNWTVIVSTFRGPMPVQQERLHEELQGSVDGGEHTPATSPPHSPSCHSRTGRSRSASPTVEHRAQLNAQLQAQLVAVQQVAAQARQSAAQAAGNPAALAAAVAALLPSILDAMDGSWRRPGNPLRTLEPHATHCVTCPRRHARHSSPNEWSCDFSDSAFL